MLVLSRFQGEKIRIGPDIVIQVVRFQGDKVKIGIEAPPDVEIWRDEIKPTTVRRPEGREK